MQLLRYYMLISILLEREMIMEEQIIKIIAIGGEARSCALMAIDGAIEGDFQKAEEMMEKSRAATSMAHEFHTQLLTMETKGAPVEVNLLLIHASNILSNAEGAYDYAEKLIKLIQTKLS